MKLILSFLVLFLAATSCSTNKKKTARLFFNSGELLYTDSIATSKANELGKYLVSCGFFDGKTKTVQVDKKNGVIHFSMIVLEGFISSEDYHNTALAFISELENNVFTGDKVEIDFCDKRFTVKKNIRSTRHSLQGEWICDDITGGDAVDDYTSQSDLALLRTNFTFVFSKDKTFESDFVNPESIREPIHIKGSFTIQGDQVSLYDLNMNGVQTTEEMAFTFVEKINSFQLISHTEGIEDLVMTFKKAG